MAENRRVELPRRDEPPPPSDQTRPENGGARVAKIGLALVVTAALLWAAGTILLVIFAGILLGVLLEGLTDGLRRRTGLGHTVALTIVAAGSALLLAGIGWLVVPNVAAQLDQLWSELTDAIGRGTALISQWSWGKALIESNPLAQLGNNAGEVLSRITGLATTTFNLVGGAAVIVFIGLYLAADPRLYTAGLVGLLPHDRRDRARQVLSELAHTLHWWLIGRAFSMVVIGATVGVGLWLLGVPLALTLGILSGLLNFVPYIGPLVAAVPGILIGFAADVQTGIWVTGLYLLAELLESYILTPVVLRRTVELPPALTLAVQLLGGLFFGIVGIAMATPLAAAGIVLTRMLWVEDRLGDRER